jgi:hypothetical protein
LAALRAAIGQLAAAQQGSGSGRPPAQITVNAAPGMSEGVLAEKLAFKLYDRG